MTVKNLFEKTIVSGLLLAASLFIPSGLTAQDSPEKPAFSIHPLFSDHAVLQQGLTVPVWGTAEPGKKITVSFGDQTVEGKADEAGQWMVALKPLTASAEGADLVAKSNGTEITVTDMLVGEVWVCSGQSNMAWSVSRTTDAEKIAEEAKAKKFDGIRLFKVPVAGADERQKTVEASWALPKPNTIANFSATGFYFGRALHRDKDVPVGLIQSANGGTNAYSWINSNTLNDDEVAETIRTYWAGMVEKGPAALERFEKQKQAWIDGGKKGRAPREPMHAGHAKRPAGHYNAMIAPLQPYAIQGVIWYQGEANSRPPFVTEYRDLMFALAKDWRYDWHHATHWNRGPKDAAERPRMFPFYIVQLPNYEPGAAWPIIREQMLKFWQDGENTGTIVSIDVGDATDIHPQNKLPIGERLARFARANAYGDDIVYSGPVYDSMMAADGKVTLTFKHTGGSLKSRDGEPLRHFEVAGGDGNFVPAEAVIEGDHLIVSARDIAEPRAVRYAWKPNPENINFVNGEDLPASPFRTDSWDLLE
ncbi:MAG: sialate O-acetylesterase [Verrucomicrobiales bacterium]|nr:sialate O-acetylesterase [Verrucomicrobiales bacterium]